MRTEDQETIPKPAPTEQRRITIRKKKQARIPQVDSTSLELHKKWIDALPHYCGIRLVLDGVYAGLYLLDADLSRSVISANLRGASLRGVKLNGADLTRAVLYEADLTGADLTDVIGLTQDNFAGTDLTRATMPPELSGFVNLKAVEEMSKNSGRYFIGLMVGCSLALLTLAGTSDVGFFTNTSTATLPILNFPVSTVSFFWVTPFLLFATFIYFHMDLQRLWDTLGRLPAVFPDGHSLNSKAYQWTLTNLVSAYSRYLTPRHMPLMWLRKPVSIFCAWWITPITLVFFWGRYLRRHDWPGTVFHSVLIVVAAMSSLLFYRLAKYTLQHRENPARLVRPRKWRLAWVYLVSGISLLGIGSDGAIRGIHVDLRSTSDHIGKQLHRKWVPRLMNWVGYRPFADLSDADISVRPAAWLGQDENGKSADLSMVKGARLQNRDLHNAYLDYAFLAKGRFQRRFIWKDVHYHIRIYERQTLVWLISKGRTSEGRISEGPSSTCAT